MKKRKFTKPKWMPYIKKFEMVLIIIAVICTAIFFRWLLSDFDLKKATDEDWHKLYEQAEIIQNQELETVVDDANLDVEIKIESEECSLILKIGEDHKFSQVIEKDNALSTFETILIVFATTFASAMFFIVFLLVELVIEEKIIWLWDERLKRKRESD